jgi:hypothetical protein
VCGSEKQKGDVERRRSKISAIHHARAKLLNCNLIKLLKKPGKPSERSKKDTTVNTWMVAHLSELHDQVHQAISQGIGCTTNYRMQSLERFETY